MAPLPIRTLTLYKQGIGFFERRGVHPGGAVTLALPREATNDVLKSLNVVVLAGGPVLGMSYETPADKAQVLAALPIKLANHTCLSDLLISLRGSTVTLRLDDGNSASGRVLGVEYASSGTYAEPVVLLHRDADLQVLPLARLHGVTLDDERARQDVRYLLDVHQTEQTVTTLSVRLPDGTHELSMSYLAPSPTWRVSYRLVGDGQGGARLHGWGIFDNTLDEDLDDVTLTLMSGRPVSFEYDLYQTRVPPRPHVSDDPTALEQVAAHPLVAESLSTLVHELRTPLTSVIGSTDVLLRGLMGSVSDDQRQLLQSARQSAQRMHSSLNDLLSLMRLRDQGDADPTLVYHAGPLGDLKVSGSYFVPVQMGNAEPEYLQYHVPTPVSVRRGQSALVPIIDAPVNYEYLCVYNGAKLPNHPLHVWRFANTSGLALEQGPVTVTEGGQYRGEGLLRFTGVGDDMQIPFALEFGILVEEQTEVLPRTPVSVTFNATTRRAQVGYAVLTEHRYELTSHINHALTIFVEQRDPSHGGYFEMPVPTLARGGHSRWPVAVDAQGSAAFTVRERAVTVYSEDVTTWGAAQIAALEASGALAENTATFLRRFAALSQAATDATNTQTALQTEYDQIRVRQEQLRKNLAALGASEREGAIRSRTLDDLERSEDRRRAIETVLVEMTQAANTRQEQQQTILNSLFGASS